MDGKIRQFFRYELRKNIHYLLFGLKMASIYQGDLTVPLMEFVVLEVGGQGDLCAACAGGVE